MISSELKIDEFLPCCGKKECNCEITADEEISEVFMYFSKSSVFYKENIENLCYWRNASLFPEKISTFCYAIFLRAAKRDTPIPVREFWSR